MPIDILMPALSPTMTEGNLVRWLKKEGDIIKAGQVLAEIETDKATMEVEAVDEGILGKIVIQEGSEGVAVNTLIALLLEDGEDASALQEIKNAPPSSTIPSTVTQSIESSVTPIKLSAETANESNTRILASPVAKRLAHLSAVDLSSIHGTGPRGRVIKTDVEQAITQKTSHSKTSVSTHSLNTDSAYTDIPLSMMRKVIAKRLVESKQTVPHFYLSVHCEIDALLALRATLNETREKSEKISVNDFVVLASAKALRKVPDVNVSFHDTYIRRYERADIAIAVAIDGGLVTPILKNACCLPLGDISSSIKILAARAREGKLQPHEFQGGSFCISNLGMYGVEQFQAIINPPQGCILAVGAGVQKAIVKKGEIVPATLMNCTLSVDHRAVDGALGAQFLSAFKGFIENPLSLLI